MNHYDWCEKYGGEFFKIVGINPSYVSSFLSCDGDKCYQYKERWENAGIPFVHGVLIYLITKSSPYVNEVRNTPNGWVDVCDWIIDNYTNNHKFFIILPVKEIEKVN